MSQACDAAADIPVSLPDIEPLTDDDILRLGDNKSLKELREKGVFLSKQTEKKIRESADRDKDFFTVAFCFLNSGKGEEISESLAFEKLATRNAKLKEDDQYTLEELHDIREHATRYIQIKQQITREAVETVKAEREEQIANQEPDEIEIAARNIINNQTVMEHFLKTFRTLHAGDNESAEVMALISMAGSSLTSEGIHFFLTGPKGSGKTSAIRAFLHMWPEEYVISGEFSPKALYYKDILPGSVVWPDDWYSTPESESFIRRAMSNFQHGTQYQTVGKGEGGNNAFMTIEIPPRVTFFYTNTTDTGSDELADRLYRLSIVPDETADNEYWEFLKNRVINGGIPTPNSKEVLICRAIISIIKKRRFKVIIPFANRIRFKSLKIRRDIEMFISFIDALTIMNHTGRKQEPGQDEEGEFTILTATEADFHQACTIYKSSENNGGREMKLSKQEMDLAIWLSEKMNSNKDGVLEQDIIKQFGVEAGLDRSAIKRLLTGRAEGNGSGGLINKIPGAHLVKVSDMETEAEENQIGARIITKRRGKSQNAYIVPLGITAQTKIDEFTFVTLDGV